RPTWQNTSLEKPRRNCALSAPNTASGTPSRMMNGSTQLSYCAASTRYTSRMLSANRYIACDPDLISSSDSPAHAKSKPCGSDLWAMSVMICSACPELTPGTAEPVISVDRNRLKWLMTAGAVVSLSRTTDDNGTMSPLDARA